MRNVRSRISVKVRIMPGRERKLLMRWSLVQ
jgi:hypothetical protein